CGGLSDREMESQVLDSMDLEKERGITIKAQTAALRYLARDGKTYRLNLIDTPGHVDFSYEVSRSLSACEGALLVVDATQGVEAQTVANCYTAIDLNVEVLPVLNKMDLPSADADSAAEEIEDVIGIDASDAVRASAKTGLGIDDILESVVAKVPHPRGSETGALQALIIDSWFDNYVGVVMLVRVVNGRLKPRDRIRLMATDTHYVCEQVGVFTPKSQSREALAAGEVGFVIAGIKELKAAKVGDTLTHVQSPALAPLPGFKEIKPSVFAGLYPVEANQYEAMREALEKLKLNDAALQFEPEVSQALGFGFRCGFLGLLHMEIVRERLEREAGLTLISTAPSVVYNVTLDDGKKLVVTNPSEYPDGKIAEVSEPIVKATILAPSEFIGTIMELCQQRRGALKGMDYLSEDRIEIRYTLPLAEIVFDFFDQLKSRTRGYASLDYEPIGEEAGDLVKVDILLQGEKVDAFSQIVHRDKAYAYGVMMTGKLHELIPRQQFEVPIQAAIGAKIIARENIRAIRKDVLAKCYGGDISRKRKLLEKQKEGKKRMKMVGRVEVPQEAFIAALTTDADKASEKKK
ncbi:MAG: elongation factor 4, partial [Betaproteobacteria bacterium]|nr:elongation factor 4 [Betaproteobacteria bacterium]